MIIFFLTLVMPIIILVGIIRLILALVKGVFKLTRILVDVGLIILPIILLAILII